jgi:hypothetical protein
VLIGGSTFSRSLGLNELLLREAVISIRSTSARGNGKEFISNLMAINS